jgi:4'-phosphopantetheinyl transferase EntD
MFTLSPVPSLDFDGLLGRCDFDGAPCGPEQYLQHGIIFPDGLRRAVNQRRAEYLAGRLCALAALRRLGLDVADIPPGPDRAPQWPPGVTGSITHRGYSSCCALAPSAVCAGVGIDLERCMERDMAAQCAPLIVDPQEQALLRRQEPAFEWLLTLVFSAKESLFKALYPAIRMYFDFLDARVIGLEPARGLLHLELKRDLGPGMRAGRRYPVRYRASGQDVLTLVWYRAS